MTFPRRSLQNPCNYPRISILNRESFSFHPLFYGHAFAGLSARESMLTLTILLWDGKIKCRTAVHHAFRPYASAVSMNNILDVGQPNARALKLVRAVQTLEYAEKLVGITRIEARTVVANEDHRLAAVTWSPTD